jgi:tRNA pseudouridine38-40 synthase
VLSAKLLIPEQQDSFGIQLSDEINAALPDDIFIISSQKTSRSFVSKEKCLYRTYEYLLPLKSLRIEENEVISKLNFYLKQFLGTNYFHNFTTHTSEDFVEKFTDKHEIRELIPNSSYRRDIIKCYAEEILTLNEEKYARIIITGNSFLRHQIRKIIGTVLAIVNGICDYILIIKDKFQKITFQLQ